MLGIIILNYNTPDDVRTCIRSIEQGTRADYKIYLVDNCSTNAAFDELTREYQADQRVTMISSEKNGGYSAGNNIGIRRAEREGCDVLLIANPDIIFYAGAIDTMLETLEAHKEAGVAAPSVLTPKGRETQLLTKPMNAKRYIFSRRPLIYFNRFFPALCKEYPLPKDREKTLIFSGMVRGCCFMIRTGLMRELGYFDENVFLYEEESILGKKLVNKGIRTAVSFRAKVIHNESGSTSRKSEAFRKYHYYLSALYYLKVYAKSSRASLGFLVAVNGLSFLLKSLYRKEYRHLLSSFMRQNMRILTSGRSAKLPGNRIRMS